LERLVEKKERFDVVVLDVMLPGKSGLMSRPCCARKELCADSDADGARACRRCAARIRVGCRMIISAEAV